MLLSDVKNNIFGCSFVQWLKKTITAPYAFGVLIFLCIARFIAMVVVPLNDSTEARYAEIARIMLETGNWITPMHRYGEPFWAKPPLSTWLSAFSMQVFGVHPWAARLPGLLLSIGVLWLVWYVAKLRSGASVALNAVLILAGSLYFLLDAGTVMTDPALLFCITLSLTAFWHALVNQNKVMSFMFFVGLGLGLLAKGPIAVVLIGLPIGAWVIWQNAWRNLWLRLPWIWGSLLMLLIAAPWYILAEMKTPGFLHYFIVGEHIMRFLQPGWTGDKYGFAHIAPYGMIWAYALLGTLPWSLVGGLVFLKNIKRPVVIPKSTDGWLSYLLLCALLPLCFFTFASNIIYPYVFPSLPALALLAAQLITPNKENNQKILWLASVSGTLFCILSLVFCFTPQYVAKSHDRVVNLFQHLKQSPSSQLIYWSYHLDYSAQFYSAGQAVYALDSDKLRSLLSKGGPHYLVEDHDVPIPLPTWVRSHLHYVKTLYILKKRLTIYRVESLQ